MASFTRFEIVTALYGLCRDLYVSLLSPLFDQPFLVELQERTRLLAVHHWLGTQGGNVSYEALKSVVFKVAADADLKSRDPPAKVYTITADTKGKTQVAQTGKRAGAIQPKKSKKAKKNAAANPAAVSASAFDAATGRTEPTARKTIIDNMSKAAGLCSRCLQPQHTTEKAADNPNRCLRALLKPKIKWSASFICAVPAEMQMTGKKV